MSDVEKKSTAGGKGWTDVEKLGILFQIIAKGGPIPWNELTLPEGRTLKAVKVMVHKEKQKARNAMGDAGEDTANTTPTPTPTPTPTRGKKRNAETAIAGNETGIPSAKKAKSSRKTKATKVVASADDREASSPSRADNSGDELKDIKTEAYDET